MIIHDITRLIVLLIFDKKKLLTNLSPMGRDLCMRSGNGSDMEDSFEIKVFLS